MWTVHGGGEQCRGHMYSLCIMHTRTTCLLCLLFFVFLSVLCFISFICALVVFYVWLCCTFLPSPLVLLPVFLSFF